MLCNVDDQRNKSYERRNLSNQLAKSFQLRDDGHRHESTQSGVVGGYDLLSYLQCNAGVKAMQMLMTRITYILLLVLPKQGKGRERPKYCWESEREGNGREPPKYFGNVHDEEQETNTVSNSSIVVGYDFLSSPQSRSGHILLRKQPQECSTSIQDYLNCIATASDSSPSYRRSERISNASNVIGYDFLSLPQSRSEHILPRKRPAFQECPNFIVTASDSSSSY